MELSLPLLFINNIFNTQPQAVLYMGISIAIGIALTALFYLLSYVFNHPPLSALAKEELATLIITVFMIGGWIFFQGVLWQFTCVIAFGTCDLGSSGSIAPGHVGVAYASLEILYMKLKSIYVGLYLYEVLIGFLSTVYVPLGTFNPLLSLLPVSVPPLVGLSLLSNAHTVLVEAIGMTMVAIIAKQHLLQFAKYAIPLVLLPLGLVLRAFPWYRTTGSSIVSICIVGYFVYPLSVMLSNFMIFDLYNPVDFVYAPDVIGFCKGEGDVSAQEALKEKTDLIYEFRKEWGTTTTTAIQSQKTDIFEILWGFVKAIGSVFKAAFDILKFMLKIFGDFASVATSMLWGSGAHVGVVSGLYYFIIHEVVIVSQFVIAVIVTSVFEIIITITMYRNISAVIGGEMELLGLSKLV